MSRQRMFAVGTVALALAILSGVSFLERERLREAWIILQLHATRVETRLRALEELGKRQSLRAVPSILELLESERDKRVREAAVLALGEMGSGIGERAMEALVDEFANYAAPGFY